MRERCHRWGDSLRDANEGVGCGGRTHGFDFEEVKFISENKGLNLDEEGLNVEENGVPLVYLPVDYQPCT